MIPMWRLTLFCMAFAVALATGGAPPHAGAQPEADRPFDASSFGIALEPIAEGFEQPVYVTGPDDGSGRLFVVERQGRILIVAGGDVDPTPFLDITNLVQSGSMEQGLLSVAFPPDFAKSGRFYVYYTARTGDGAGDNTVARFRVSPDDPNVADPESGEVLLAVPDARVNHNAGQLQFGPDGMLYVALGDGGGGGDPEGNGQNPMTRLGSVLRIDVSRDGGYAIPTDNPFADGERGAPEVWVWGLRNPWRFSFDRATGDLWIGDVGQGAREEVTMLTPEEAGGANLGWNVMEGSLCFRADDCETEGVIFPVVEYSRDFGCSVVGGYVYRGEREPELEGVYLFADYCTGLLWGFGRDAAGSWSLSAPIETGLQISSFGEDAHGELYVVGLGGELARVRFSA